LQFLEAIQEKISCKNLIKADEAKQFQEFRKKPQKFEALQKKKEKSLEKQEILNKKLSSIEKRSNDVNKSICLWKQRERKLTKKMEDFSKNQDFLKLSSNESRENFDLKTECDFFVENNIEQLEKIEEIYSLEANRFLGSNSDVVSLSKKGVKNLLDIESNNTLQYIALSKKRYDEIADLINIKVDSLNQTAFCDSVIMCSSNDDHDKKKLLLNDAYRSVLGYSARKRHVVCATAEYHSVAAMVKELHEHIKSSVGKDDEDFCSRQNSIKEKEKEINAVTELIDAKLQIELDMITSKGAKLEREYLFGGEYRQKLLKLQLFNDFQSKVKNFLVGQQTRMYFIWILHQLQISHWQQTNNFVSNLQKDLETENKKSYIRSVHLNRMEDLNETSEKSLIRTTDKVMTSIYDSLDPLEEDNDNLSVRLFADLKSAASSLKERSLSFKRLINGYDSQNCNLQTLKKLIEKLCIDQTDGKAFLIKMNEDKIASNISTISEQLENIKCEFTNSAIFEKIEEQQNLLNANPNLFQQKYIWAKKVLDYEEDQPKLCD